MDRLDIEFTAC